MLTEQARATARTGPKPVRTGTNRHTHQRKACQPPAARAALWRGIAAMRVEDTRRRRMERETGIEPATNSLEGCDSTTELLPPSWLATFADSLTAAGTPAV